MKILFFHNLPSGGGIRMLEEIIKWTISKGHRVTLIVISHTKPKKIKNVNVEWIKLENKQGFVLNLLWRYFELKKIHKYAYEKIIANQKFDKYIITHDYLTKSPYLLRFLPKSKVLYLCQEPQREYYENIMYFCSSIKDLIIWLIRLPIKYIDEKNVSYAGTILCNSLFSKKRIRAIYHKEPIVVYPGVDTRRFRRNTLVKRENRVLCVGGMNKIKNQMLIARALCLTYSKPTLVLIGQRNEKYYESIIKIYKNIETFENVPDDYLIKEYNRAKVTCISAHNEPFGLSAVESIACGTPIVMAGEGGAKEVISDPEVGISCNNKPQEIACAIDKIMNRKYSSIPRKIINKWDWNSTLSVLSDIL